MIDPATRLAGLRRDGLYRELRAVERWSDTRAVIDGREVVVLCSNDYLGLRNHPGLQQAAADAAHLWGAGAGSSRLIAGNFELHRRLEEETAAFKGHDRCILFGSGYLANVGVISALAGPGDLILSDALNHASIIDGCRMSRAETVVYPHADLDALAETLHRAGRRDVLVVTDAVFSMDGDLAPLQEIVDLAHRHGARVLVDEAHATGVVGPDGRGLVAALGLEDQVDVVVGTFSKALGSYGAFACCAGDLADYLVNRARTLIFSTAPPPPSVAASLAALQILSEEPQLVERLRENARLLRRELALPDASDAAAQTPIIPLIVGDAVEAMAMCEAALAAGVFVQAIRPPTVPPGTSRLRAAVSAAHTADELREAAHVLAAVSGGRF